MSFFRVSTLNSPPDKWGSVGGVMIMMDSFGNFQVGGRFGFLTFVHCTIIVYEEQVLVPQICILHSQNILHLHFLYVQLISRYSHRGKDLCCALIFFSLLFFFLLEVVVGFLSSAEPGTGKSHVPRVRGISCIRWGVNKAWSPKSLRNTMASTERWRQTRKPRPSSISNPIHLDTWFNQLQDRWPLFLMRLLLHETDAHISTHVLYSIICRRILSLFTSYIFLPYKVIQCVIVCSIHINSWSQQKTGTL